jgi:hypothetical protein
MGQQGGLQHVGSGQHLTSRARWTGGNGCNNEITWTCITTNFYPTKNCKTSSFHLVTSDTLNYTI